MTDLLLVEKVAREICIALGDEPDREGPFDEWYEGSAYETMAKIAIAASDRAAEQRAQPVTVASLYGYEAGLVEGARAQWEPIETAPAGELNLILLWNGVEVTGGARWGSGWADWIHDWLDPQPSHWMPLPSPPSIADDGKEGAG